MVTRLFKGVGLILMLSSLLYAGIRVRPHDLGRVWIDASRPRDIHAPFDVVPIGPDGQRGLWIGPGVGRGWRNEAGGDATYHFEAPCDGTYHIWAYCLWHDECTNAIYVQIDDADKAILGNDPVFNQWHWTRGFSLYLKRGPHRLVLSNHSDNIAVLQLYLTNSPSDHPDRNAPSFVELFYEGFDGCDDGNFIAWKRHAGQWTVKHPDDVADLSKKILIGQSRDEAMITFTSQDWRQYVMNVSVKTVSMDGPGASAAICFGLYAPDSFYALQWSDQPGADKTTLTLLRRKGTAQDRLGEFPTPWAQGAWHDVEIRLEADSVVVKVDGVRRGQAVLSDPVHGGIGLLLVGKVEAHFDDIHVRMLDSPGSQAPGQAKGQGE